MCGNLERNIYTDATSNTVCLEVLEGFAATAVEPGYNPGSYVDFSNKDQILRELVTSYKEPRAAGVNIEECLDISAPNAVIF